MATKANKPEPTATMDAVAENGALTLRVAGRLDAGSAGRLWRQADRELEIKKPTALTVDVSDVDYVDGAGVGLLIHLSRHCMPEEESVRIKGLREEVRELVIAHDLYDPQAFKTKPEIVTECVPLPEIVGRGTESLAVDLRDLVVFVGRVVSSIWEVIRRPHKLRWKDALMIAEDAGVKALPVVFLIGLITGLIIAFQSAIQLGRLGMDIFTADIVSVTMLRELGPLMTAIVLAGRTGSAFAAEIGTMKVNEEVDALRTMGLDPVKFLVTTRMLAVLAVAPVLTIFADLAGLVGGGLVMLWIDFPLVTYVTQVEYAVNYVDLLGGLFKSVVFGVIVAGVGCARGLGTGTGAVAVGRSTTSSVVTSIVLIVVVDGVFSILYYRLGI